MGSERSVHDGLSAVSGMEIAPCPFCKGTDIEVGGLLFDHFVWCRYDNARGPTAPDETEAIERWNAGRSE